MKGASMDREFDDGLRDDLDQVLATAAGNDETVEWLVRRHLHSAVYLFQQQFILRVVRDLSRELFLSGDVASLADHLPKMNDLIEASLREFYALLRTEIRRVGQLQEEVPN